MEHYRPEKFISSENLFDGDLFREVVKRIKEVIELCLEEAKADPVYRAKINLEEASSDKFLGITSVPARVSF